MFSTKRFFAVSLITTSLFAASWGVNAATESATINLSATVVDNTCTPEWTAGGVSVDMNRVSAKDFGGDKIGAAKTFDLKLTDCGSGASTVTVTATGAPDSTDDGLFSNTEAEGASGVAFRIKGDNSQSTQMKPNGDGSVEYTITNNAADMTFLAELMQTGETAPESGAVKSTVTMMIDYN